MSTWSLQNALKFQDDASVVITQVRHGQCHSKVEACAIHSKVDTQNDSVDETSVLQLFPSIGIMKMLTFSNTYF